MMIFLSLLNDDLAMEHVHAAGVVNFAFLIGWNFDRCNFFAWLNPYQMN